MQRATPSINFKFCGSQTNKFERKNLLVWVFSKIEIDAWRSSLIISLLLTTIPWLIKVGQKLFAVK